ncbi:MAG: rhomboid family intramembrane serine protease [Clostridium sp.]|nr:rhomboid family intramembrane serine protease [Clostridium sp.]
MNLIDRLERKFGKYAIRNLPMYICGLNLLVYLLGLLDTNIYRHIFLIPQLVIKGEVWRLITYVFIPPETSYSSIIWILFILYFYYTMSTTLENEWGSFRFNIYYFAGMLGTTIASFIFQIPATAVFINLSIFLAFAHLYPEYRIYIFMLIPIKIKYLGWLSWAFIGYKLIVYPPFMKVYVLIPIINFFLFFAKDIYMEYRTKGNAAYRRRKFKGSHKEKLYIHKCTVCGITEKDDPNMEFRYCLTCEGNYEYCMEHLKNHEHIRKK